MKTMALIAAMILAGCDAAPGSTDELGPAGPGLDATAALAGRGLATGSLAEIHLLATQRGRELLSRVVSCALPRGAAIRTIGRDGTPYWFAGRLGLAPGWADHALSAGERRRVTGCVRARASGTCPA